MNLTERLDIIAVKLLNKWFKDLGVLFLNRDFSGTQKYNSTGYGSLVIVLSLSVWEFVILIPARASHVKPKMLK
jgi:hypothetical protein